ncbi:MAG: four helix bundle protein [Ignavibacteriales bacterium]|nr:four helix bundle protein [Ignavibacteriales bacterium]
MAEKIPQNVTGKIITGQLVGAGTSVGSNYRAACRARSKREFNSKLQTAQEEADESAYWIEVLLESGMVQGEDWVSLHSEADQLTAIVTKSLITSRGRR